MAMALAEVADRGYVIEIGHIVLSDASKRWAPTRKARPLILAANKIAMDSGQ
jgi:ABC-type branched-subunit amino acid transport system ATPase component